MNEEEGEEAAGGQGRSLREDGKKTEAVKKKGTNPRHFGVAGIHHVIALPGSRGPTHMMIGQ